MFRPDGPNRGLWGFGGAFPDPRRQRERVIHSGTMENSNHLVQILLPIYDNEQQRFGSEIFSVTREELTERFGGLTAHMRAPARGVWKTDNGDEARDDIVIFEVMTERVDREWWDAYRRRLEERFRQDAIVIRAMPISIL